MLGNPTLSLGHVNLAAAQELGYWKNAGVNVKIQLTQGTAQATQDLTSGLGQMAQTDSLQIAQAVSRGQTGFEAVCSYVADNIFVMLTKKGSPITSAKDLIGKKIGIQGLGTGGYQYAQELLKSAGASNPTKAATFTVIPTPAAQLNALEDGTIDALSSIDVTLGTYTAQGHQLQALTQTGGAAWWWNEVIATKSFVNAHPDAVAAVCKGIQAGELLTVTSPTAALAVYKNDPLGGTEGLGSLKDAQALDVINSRAKPGFITYPQGNSQWGWLNVSGEQQLIDEFASIGFIPKSFDASQYYTDQFVAAMQPDASQVKADAAQYGSSS